MVLQFDRNVDSFWADFRQANPGKTEFQLNAHFDKKYGQCFAKGGVIHSSSESQELPAAAAQIVRACMLT